MKSIAGNIGRIVAPILGKRGFAEAEVVLRWASIVGQELARLSAPVKLSFAPPGLKPAEAAGGGRVDGTLYLKVAPGAALDIQHLEPAIIERVNTYFGYRAVARLALRQGPLPPPKTSRPPPRALSRDEARALEARLDGIVDPELRAALERLGRSIIARES